MSQEKTIKLEIDCPSIIRCEIDVNALERVLTNIISNAIKYTFNNGQVQIKTYLSSGNEFTIEINDTGIGIPEQELSRIFEPFYRVSVHENIAEGTGLGLSIVKKIIERQNGSITVTSQVNQGTTFTIILPAKT